MKHQFIFFDGVPKSFQKKLTERIEFAPVSESNTGATGIFLRSNPKIDRDFIDHYPSLRLIVRFGSGVEHIDVEYAHSKGIEVINAPEGNAPAVGEFCVGLLIALTRNMFLSAQNLLNGIWERDSIRGTELKNLSIGIIGFGNTGRAFAKYLQGFGMDILVYDKYQTITPRAGIRIGDLNEIQKNADIISLHIDERGENYNFVDFEFLSQCKNGVSLINTSRGNVLDINALTETLKSGQVSGACLDVLPFEKKGFSEIETQNPEFDFLIHHPKVILTSHIAGLSKNSLARTEQILEERVFAFCSELGVKKRL